MGAEARITAVLGPTNTGKTQYAIERMLGHKSGVIGLPLRLLAREVYDKLVALRGADQVALVTGEEHLVPGRARYWVCTVEAMPTDIAPDFLAVDEIQLCADPERGHVFTDRLLHARGTVETVFLGAATMRPALQRLVPQARFEVRERFSTLTHTGERKLSRMAPRSAIVGFSVENIYAIAELLRRQKGGAAVVMGALSPRTRNAQVALYQNGDVDYLVATDAIGMGLNLDIEHVAFSALHKFDGRRMRPLSPAEIGQIAGRAGRYLNHGTFGTTGEAGRFDPDLAEAVENHRFEPLRKLQWRNARLNFGSIGALIAALEMHTDDPLLTRVRDCDDLVALKTLADTAEVRARCRNGRDVALLWDVCRIPDYRDISPGEHSALLSRIFEFLHELGRIPDDWLAAQIARIDRTEGDIDTLSRRLAFVRTWTYVAQRRGWLDDESHWREVTRAVEDRLSDALHAALTQRFVDRRTSVLLRRLKQKEALVAEVNENGEVTVEGHMIGRLEGFIFRQDASAEGQEARTLRQTAFQVLAPEFNLRADRFYNAPDTEIDFTDQGGLMWGGQALGKLVAGSEPLKPRIEVFVDEEAGADVRAKVERRLQHFMDRRIATLFEPLLAIGKDESLAGLARGFGFQLLEHLGIIPREVVAAEVKALDQELRGALRKLGVRFGQYTVFLPALLKPAPTRLRLLLWALSQKLQEFPSAPPPGLVTIPVVEVPEGCYTMSGYRRAGQRAIRIDMLERLADLLRAKDSRGGFEATADMLSITGMTLEQFADLMQGLGYGAVRGERVKPRPASEGAAAADAVEPAAAPSEAASAVAEPAEVAPAMTDAVTDAVTEAMADAQVPTATDAPAADPAAAAAHAGTEPAETETAATEPAEAEPPVAEVFYTFAWRPNRPARGTGGERPQRGQHRNRGPEGEAAPRAERADRGDRGQGKPRQRQDGKPRAKGKPQGKAGLREEGKRDYSARPPRKDRIDPDNPFAALAGLKLKP